MAGRRPYATIAAKQFGLVTTAQLRGAGISKARAARLVASGDLEPVRKRVYRIAGTAPTWMSTVLAAALAAGDGAVVSHETAAYLWQLRHVGRPTLIHLLAPKRLQLAGVRWHRAPAIPEVATRYRRIPVTTVELTVALIADSYDTARLGEMVDDALRRGILRLERLRRVAVALDGPGRRNLDSLKVVLAERPRHYGPGDSDWERDQDSLWHRLGLPAAVRQHRVTVPSGRRYIVDRALPDLKIIVEWDGYAFHRDRTAFDRDRRRDSELTAAGWAVLRFTSNSTPAFIARTVRDTVDRQQQMRQQQTRQQQTRQLSPVGPAATEATPP